MHIGKNSKNGIARWLRRGMGLGGCVAVWCVLSYGGVVPPGFLPSPTGVIARFFDMVENGYANSSLWEHTYHSVFRTLTGFFLGVAIGTPTGLLLGYSQRFEESIGPIFSFLRPIPPIAYTPLFVLYLGIGDASKIVLIFMGAFLYMLLSAQAGVRNIPEVLIRAGRNAGLDGARLFMKVILPGSLPGIMTGARTGLAVSWALVVAAELIAAQAGLGYMVANAGVFFDIETLFVGIILIGVVGLILDRSILAVEKRLLHWQGR